jgi:hypothetical protein
MCERKLRLRSEPTQTSKSKKQKAHCAQITNRAVSLCGARFKNQKGVIFKRCAAFSNTRYRPTLCAPIHIEEHMHGQQ